MFVVFYCLFILQVKKEKRLTKRFKNYILNLIINHFTGKTMKEYQSEQISTAYLLGHKMYLTPPWSDSNIIISDNKFYFVVDGEIEITTEKEKIKATAGELMLIPAGLKHSYNLTKTGFAKLYWFHFSMQLNEKGFFDCYELPLKIAVSNIPRIKSLFNTLFKHATIDEPTSKIKVINPIHSLVEYYISKGSYIEKQTEKTDVDYIVEYIKQNYNEKITLSDLAQKINFTPTYFIKKFKQETGYSPINYINIVKLEEAKYLLEQTSDPINTIMEKVGFYDSAHFSKIFKKHYGFSPSKYREISQSMKEDRIK